MTATLQRGAPLATFHPTTKRPPVRGGWRALHIVQLTRGIVMPSSTPKQDPPYRSDVHSSVPRAALAHARGDATGRLVLFALGTFRRGSETECYPSVATLSAITALGERTVRLTLQRLVRSGALVVVRKHTQQQPTVYRLQTGSFCGSERPPDTAPDRQFVHARGAESAPEVTTEDTTRTTTPSRDRPSPRPAVQGREATGGGSLDHRKPPNPRIANRGGLTLVGAAMPGVVAALTAEVA